MNKAVMAVAIAAMLIVAGVAAVLVLNNDSDDGDPETVSTSLYLDMNDGSEVNGYELITPNSLRSMVMELNNKGYNVVLDNNGTISSVNNTTQTDSKAWTTWKWTASGWKIISSVDSEAPEENGIYMICFSNYTITSGVKTFQPSTYTFDFTVYIFLVEEDRAVWITGKGGIAVEAIADAFASAGIEFHCEETGWVITLNNRTQTEMLNDGAYLYHVQYRLKANPSGGNGNWIYNSLTLANYDLNQDNVFAFIWGVSYEDLSKSSFPTDPKIPDYVFDRYVFADTGETYDPRSGYTDRPLNIIWSVEP